MTGTGQPEPQRRDGQDDHDRHEHRGNPIGKSLHGCLAGLRRFDQPGHLGQRCLRTDPRRPHDQPAGDVDRCPRHDASFGDIDRHALSREERCIDRGRALLDDTIGRDPLPGQHRESIADT